MGALPKASSIWLEKDRDALVSVLSRALRHPLVTLGLDRLPFGYLESVVCFALGRNNSGQNAAVPGDAEVGVLIRKGGRVPMGSLFQAS